MNRDTHSLSLSLSRKDATTEKVYFMFVSRLCTTINENFRKLKVPDEFFSNVQCL